MVQRLPTLVRLAIGQGQHMHLGKVRCQCRLHCLRIQRGHSGVGDDERAAALGQVGPSAGVRQQARTDEDGVAAVTQMDVNRLDRGMGHGNCSVRR